jgi:hypothetical protein
MQQTQVNEKYMGLIGPLIQLVGTHVIGGSSREVVLEVRVDISKRSANPEVFDAAVTDLRRVQGRTWDSYGVPIPLKVELKYS